MMRLRTKKDAANTILKMSRMDIFELLDDTLYEEDARDFIKNKNEVIGKIIETQREISSIESKFHNLKKKKYLLEYYDLMDIDAKAIEENLVLEKH